MDTPMASTDNTTRRSGKASQPGALREAEHDRELHEVSVAVTDVTQPLPSVRRIAARLEEWVDDPNWSLPNVAFRIHLGPEFGGISRIYTVRDYHAESGIFTFDVVLHDDPSPMMQWSAALQQGDRFALTGPRPHVGIPEPQDEKRKIALFLDETAIPALWSMLKSWPHGMAGTGWVVAADPAAFAELPRVPGLTLHRIDPAQPGEPREPLLARARALEDPRGHIVWGAGERSEMRAIRQHFVTTMGMARQDVAIAGYWKRGVSNTRIDARRHEDYEKLIAAGGTLADFDDLAVEV